VTPFAEIEARAAKRKGGTAALARLLGSEPDTTARLRKTPDDRWLAGMTRSVFQAGFNWKVIEAMWPGFEAAFHGFDLAKCARISEAGVAKLAKDTSIVRNAPKIRSVVKNAQFLGEVASEAGSVGRWFADWPTEDYVGLLMVLKTRGDHLGLSTAGYFLRHMGVDGFLLGQDGTAALIDAGVIEGPATGKKALAAVQAAMNDWRAETGYSLTRLSRILGLSTGANRHGDGLPPDFPDELR
jgi:3-methyladenine DNA glycosylase Tag